MADQKSTNRTMECWFLAGKKCQGRMENSETQFTCGSSPDFSDTLILLSFLSSTNPPFRLTEEQPNSQLFLCPLFPLVGQIEKLHLYAHRS